MIAKNIITHLEKDFPASLAYDWDNVGLQVGDINQDIQSVLITLDVTLEVINEAIMMDANMIVAHHPMIFHPLKQILTTKLSGKMIEMLIKHDIVLYIMHTNYDISNKGMNKMLAEKLDLTNQKVIEFTTEEEGLGRIGDVKETTLQEIISRVKTAFDVNHVRAIGELHQKVKKIAIVGGSGSSIIEQAVALKADLLITGDIGYHNALDMKSAGLLGIDPGHHIEVAFVDALHNILTEEFDELLIVKSKTNTNPYQII